MTPARIALAIGLTVLLTAAFGCRSSSEPTESGPSTPKSSASNTPSTAASNHPASTVNVGDTVVVAHQPTSFRQGIITRIEPASVHYRYGGGGKEQPRQDQALPSRVWPLGPPKKIRQGSDGICQVEPKTWVACRIDKVHEGHIKARDSSDRPLNLVPARFIAPGSATQADIALAFKRQAEARQFDAALFDAMARQAAKAPCPKVGTSVIGRYGDFHPARVVKHNKKCSSITIEWLKPMKGERTVKPFELVALAPRNAPPEPKTFVLRPVGTNGRLMAYKVQSVSEGYLTLAGRNGKTTKVTSSELIHIGP